MSRAKLSRSRRILLLGAIGLLLLLASWFDSTRNYSDLEASLPSPLPNWRFLLSASSGKFIILKHVYARPAGVSSEGSVSFKRTFDLTKDFDLHADPEFYFFDKQDGLRITVPYWLIVLLYLAVWLGILAVPPLIRRLKHPRPPA